MQNPYSQNKPFNEKFVGDGKDVGIGAGVLVGIEARVATTAASMVACGSSARAGGWLRLQEARSRQNAIHKLVRSCWFIFFEEADAI